MFLTKQLWSHGLEIGQACLMYLWAGSPQINATFLSSGGSL